MTEYSHNSVILKKNNEVRFNQLWGTFAKSQPNAMRLSEFMQFVVDRCLVNNKVTLQHFYGLFEMATKKRTLLQKEQITQNEKATVVLQRTIKKQQFVFLLNQLGKHVYHNASNYQDRVYNDLLGEKLTAEKDEMHYSRVMIMDEINRKMLMENSVRTLCEYETELKNIYMIYVEENYFSMKRQNRLLLTHREIELQNKRMSAVGFVRFLKDAEVVPHMINIQHVEEILSRVVPPSGIKENQFYYKHFLVESYSKDLDNSQLKHQGDPGLLLFEFEFALGRIAIETSKEMDNAKKVYDYVFNKFFGGYLSLRKNEQLKDKNNKLPEYNKPFLHNLKKFYQLVQDQNVDKDEESQAEDDYNPFEQMVQNQKNLQKLPPLQFHIPSMLKALNQELPPMPEPIVVKQENPPPYPAKFKDVEKITIGQQPPPQKVDKKGQQKPPPKKANQLKKGQKPPRVFQFFSKQQQTKKIQSSEDYFQKLATDLDYSLKPLSSLERGNIPLDPFPSLITEILYPPEIPEEVLPYIEAALNAHNESRFALALQNYKKAHESWKQIANLNDLSSSLEMYFEFTKGSVYLSAGKDDYAFNCFFNCRTFLDKIPYLNPDRALPYCGIGQALYNAQQYELSARAYLKARQIRQSLLGIESVDTATVFNNLGCCFFMLDRSKQALSYFKVSSAVMVSQLGEFHERSQTTKQNINLCNKAFYVNVPEYRKLWQVFEKDPFGKKKKKKKKDGKKK